VLPAISTPHPDPYLAHAAATREVEEGVLEKSTLKRRVRSLTIREFFSKPQLTTVFLNIYLQ